MKSEAEVYGLFYYLWDAFLRQKFPEAEEDLIAGWVDNTQIEISDGELKCWFEAPVEWREFKEFYDNTILSINKALLEGVNSNHGSDVQKTR